MINILKEINDYFKIILYYISRNELDKLILGSAKRSGKSYGVAHIIIWLMVTEGFNVIALRKNSSKLKESVWTELCNVISDWNLKKWFKISQSPADMRITYLPYGNQIIFKGVNSGSADKDANAAALGSFNFYSLTSKKIKPKMIAWFEEAYEFEDNDIITTIMSYPTFDKVITFMTFNNWSSTRKIVQDLDKYAKGNITQLENDGIIWQYVNNEEHSQTLFMRTSAWVNRDHLNKETIAEFNNLKLYDYRKYNTIVLGMSGVSGDICYSSFDRNRVGVNQLEFNEILTEHFGYVLEPDYYRIGIDYGRKKDFNAFVFKKCYGQNEEIMYVDRARGFTNENQIHEKDNIDIANEVIKFILECVKDNPMAKYRKLIVQIDRSAEGLYDLVFRQIYKGYLRDSQGDFIRDYVFIVESWKDRIMQRVEYDNFLFRRNHHYINIDRALPLLDEIENIRLNINTKGEYVREDANDHFINAWEYTSTKDDRRKQLSNSETVFHSITNLDLEVFQNDKRMY